MRVLNPTIRSAILAFLVAAGPAGAAPIPPQAGELARLDHLAQGDLSSRPVYADIDGKVAALYGTDTDHVAFTFAGKTTLLDQSLKYKGGRFFQLDRDGNNLYALWWNHEGAKALYCAVSTDGGKTFAAPVVVNSADGVLPPFTLLRGKSGQLGVVYMDERVPKYEIYFNHSTDNGRHWNPHDQRLDTPPKAPTESSAMFPKMLRTGSQWVVVWTDTAAADGQIKKRLLVRRTADEGHTWSAPEVIYDSVSELTSMDALATGDTVVLAVQDTLKGLIALSSHDGGTHWADLGPAPGSTSTNNSGIQLALDGNRIQAVWSAQKDANDKGAVMTDSLDLATRKWGPKVARLDTGKPHNQTLSLQPNIAVTGSGAVVVSWTDFRNVRPNIYLSASFDHGRSWSAPQDIEAPGKFASIFGDLSAQKDSVRISYERFTSDDHKVREGVLREIALAPGHGFAGLNEQAAAMPSLQQRERQLKDRVASFWKLRVAKQFGKTYGYFDPAYRNAVNIVDFNKVQGNITYHSAVPGKVKIDGDFAEVTVKVKYEVSGVEVMGKKIKVAPTTADVTVPWVYLDNNWYMVYQDQMGKPMMQY